MIKGLIVIGVASVVIMYSALAVRSEHDRQQDDEDQMKFIREYNRKNGR